MTNTDTKNSKPSHRIYLVTGEGQKVQWTAIGAAWPTRSGGFSQTFSAYPANGGRLIMQPIQENPASEVDPTT